MLAEFILNPHIPTNCENFYFASITFSILQMWCWQNSFSILHLTFQHIVRNFPELNETGLTVIAVFSVESLIRIQMNGVCFCWIQKAWNFVICCAIYWIPATELFDWQNVVFSSRVCLRWGWYRCDCWNVIFSWQLVV